MVEQRLGRDCPLASASIVSHSNSILSPVSRRKVARLFRSITCSKCIVGRETIVYCFPAQLAFWWSSLISKAIHGPWIHIICSSVEMISLILRLAISCNYWDGISTVSMINGRLTLFVLACHWLAESLRYYMSFTQRHIHRNILNTSSITLNRKSFDNNRDNCQSKKTLGGGNGWTNQPLVFPRRPFYLFLCRCQKLSLTNFPSLVPHKHHLSHTFLFFFLLQIISLGCSGNSQGARCLQVHISGGVFVNR